MKKKLLIALFAVCIITIAYVCISQDGKPLIIREGVTVIEDGAYQGRNFEAVVIPSTVTRIGASAFENCKKLKTIAIPASVTEIGHGAFSKCENLTTVELAEGLTEIGEWAFANCKSLTAITVPSSVTKIGSDTFSRCSALADIALNGEAEIHRNAFRDCEAIRSLTVTGTIIAKNLSNAINDSKLPVKVTVSDTVTAISAHAFDKSKNLTSVTIPSSVTRIDRNAFYHCSALTDISLYGETIIAEDAFCKCNAIRSLTIGGAVLGGHPGYAIKDSTTPVTVVLSDTVTNIEEDAFADCGSLSQITLSNTLTVVGDRAFSCCGGLKQIVLPDTVTAIGRGAFSQCSSLTQIVLPDSVTAIADSAFDETPLWEDMKALVPADYDSAQDLTVPLKELTAGKKILPIKNGPFALSGSLYVMMPAALRTYIGHDADFLLTTNVRYERRNDYTLSAADTITEVYLCAKDGPVYRVCAIRHEPPLSGRVEWGKTLTGDIATSKEIWAAIEKRLNETN